MKMGKEKLDVHVVVIGRVDSDKTTSTGHLLSTSAEVLTSQFKKKAAELDKGSFKYGWDLDKLKAKSERGTTITITLQKFDTPKHNVTVIEHPAAGLHEEHDHWYIAGRLRHSHHRR
ncbi:hypothetical protein CF326_g6664 [Tilletia indica]|nr:hypothetical protein CF326_g6664 [Tilletia indica]